jgi:hypothetical protein
MKVTLLSLLLLVVVESTNADQSSTSPRRLIGWPRSKSLPDYAKKKVQL